MDCPHCGDDLDRINAGRAICPSCEAEYFISERTTYPKFGKKSSRLILEEFKPPSLEPDTPANPPFEGDPEEVAFPKDLMNMPTLQTPYHEDFFAQYMQPAPYPAENSCEVHLPLDGYCILCRQEAKGD